MTVLTQHILQQALIKKKLEEQKENYRRKHETGKQVELEFFVFKNSMFHVFNSFGGKR